ncbi:hypothetical protein ACLOJK_020707 [Asimina triloba]
MRINLNSDSSLAAAHSDCSGRLGFVLLAGVYNVERPADALRSSWHGDEALLSCLLRILQQGGFVLVWSALLSTEIFGADAGFPVCSWSRCRSLFRVGSRFLGLLSVIMAELDRRCCCLDRTVLLVLDWLDREG